ncbi:MAG: hypothetical protein ACKO85_03935, partial [Isosphaeraceae bacterium]
MKFQRSPYNRPRFYRRLATFVGSGLLLGLSVIAQDAAPAADPVAAIQADAITTKTGRKPRPWHFGSQPANDVYTNHTSHSNRLIPVYAFGSKIRLADVAGANSLYRDQARIDALYGYKVANTLNPEAEYFDQTDLMKLQKEAVDRGVKHLFVVWFDGLDWETTQAAAAAKTGQIYTAGKGVGLIFQDYTANNTAQYGFYVTSPSHDEPAKNDVNAQTISFDADTVRGGYDAAIAGPNPWTPGPLAARAPGYLKGAAGNAADKKGVLDAGRAIHAFTDSSTSAASAFN